ncbi:MAG: lysophospholipase [Candidatus Hydrogenedentes bacterium]|nr:lysophospholipase [Candidatus Hydrogenedentota bacterium]
MVYEGRFKSQDGLDLYERGWEPGTGLRGRVVLIHGYGEHCSRYVEMARVFNAAGFAIHTYDQRGFGQSPGERGSVRNFELLLQDVDTFLEHVYPRLAGKPWFMMGHSMGGLVLASYAETRTVEARGLVFSSPFLALNASPFLITVAGIVAVLTPWMPIAWVDHPARSRDPKAVEDAMKDPLIYPGPVRAFTGVEFKRVVLRARANFHHITSPAYIIHGTGDRIVPNEGSRLLYAQCASQDKTLRIYEGGYHELWNDIEKADVMAGICDWLAAHI